MDLEDMEVVEAMDREGGPFMRALAEAAKRADAANLAKIKATWADQWTRYADIARLWREDRKRED